MGTAGGTGAAPTTGSTTEGWSHDGTGATEPVNDTAATSDTVNFGNGATGLATGSITVSGTVDTNKLVVASDQGTDFVVETSESLTPPWAAAILSPDPGFRVTLTGNDVTYTFPAGTKNFARLKVTGP